MLVNAGVLVEETFAHGLEARLLLGGNLRQ